MKNRLVVMSALMGLLVPAPQLPTRSANACSCAIEDEFLELEFDAAFAGGSPITDTTQYQTLRTTLSNEGRIKLEIREGAVWHVTYFTKD